MGAWGIKALESDEGLNMIGIWERVELRRDENSGGIDPQWLEHLDWLTGRLISEQEA